MNRINHHTLLTSLFILLGLTTTIPALAADSNLVYSPVEPCRIFDTRFSGGPIAAGTAEDFYVHGDAATIGAQGGNPSGCPAPQGEPVAVHLNITVVPAGGPGHLTVYPKGTTMPNASVINYTPGITVANTMTVKTTFDIADLDITVFSADTANVLADVQGYYYPKLKNVITVSAQYADFTSPIDALNAIPTTGPNAPSATNPYLIEIGPGTYNLSSNLVMKEWVDIKGTDGREATILTAAVGSGGFTSPALVLGANDAELADITIINTGGSTHSYAIYNNASSPNIRRIKARATGGSSINVGIFNDNSAAPSISNVNVAASGGFTNHGIYNNNANPVMKEVTAVVSGGTSNIAVYVSGSSTSMINVVAKASGGSAVSNGISIVNNASVDIRFSTLEGVAGGGGSGAGLATDSTSTAKVSSSTLIGGASGTTANNNCIYVADGNNNALDANCLVPPP